MKWQGLLVLVLGILFNFFLFLILYLSFLAVTSFLIPPRFFIPGRVFVIAHLVPAGWVSWLIWRRVALLLKHHLGSEWEPDWDALVKRITGRF